MIYLKSIFQGQTAVILYKLEAKEKHFSNFKIQEMHPLSEDHAHEDIM